LTVAVVTGGPAHAGLDGLVASAAGGADDTFVARVDGSDGAALTERVLDADALLLAAPIVLFGLPGALKTWLDTWVELPRGTLTPRTAGKGAGYLAVYAADDPAAPAALDAQLKGIFGFLGMDFRGKVVVHGEPHAADREAAARLGAALGGAAGFAGRPDEYLAGIERFNAGEFWDAHEEWEELWLGADTADRAFYQGLIQVAAAFHHHGNGNWSGMRALLDEGCGKLERYRPRACGLDVDRFLAELEPWRQLARARTGKGPPALRIPDEPPRLALD
jgi:hypothetical protein